MSRKKYLALLTALLMIGYALLKMPATHVAQAEDDQIPSDLSLDLDLAQKDPAPAQKQIISSQTPQAKIVTDKGEQAVVTVKDEVPQEVKLQSAKEVENPEQTTSEQVVDKNVENDQNQSAPVASGSPASSSAGNIIPGTNILEPDDNTAQTNPTSTPSGSSTENSVQPTNSPTQSETQQPANTTNTIPPENGAAPSAAPSQGSSTENAAPAASGNNDSGGSSSGGSESTSPESPAVQGVSTGSNFLRQFINEIIGALK